MIGQVCQTNNMGYNVAMFDNRHACSNPLTFLEPDEAHWSVYGSVPPEHFW